ncbi:MAG: AAA family ATPase [Acidobacteria bacterium]|nr:AAA family ATPase [Acidobacteriota bacterium]
MTPFIPDKIAPPLELPRISRARLISTLKESLACCNSTIIQGRTGTGKTMLATDFARQCGRRVAWYKADAPDVELQIFFQYLCASVAAERPGFGQKTLERFGDHVGLNDVPLLVEYFVYELLESNEPLLIVIDDLHLVYDAEWMVPLFRRLLPLLPREAHVCLIGRSLPPTPLWRMRSKQTLCVVDEPELAFTLEEADKLFASYGLPVERAEAALARTRGRAATLDAQAKSEGVAEEAAKLVAARAGTRQSRPLHLIKKFPKSSMDTA